MMDRWEKEGDGWGGVWGKGDKECYNQNQIKITLSSMQIMRKKTRKGQDRGQVPTIKSLSPQVWVLTIQSNCF